MDMSTSLVDTLAPLRAEQLDLAAKRQVINARLAVLHSEITQIETQIRSAKADMPDPMANVIVAEPAGIMPMQVLETVKIEAVQPPVPAPKPFNPRITDHAVIRYLERAHGFDFGTVKRSLLTATVIAAMRAGATSVKTDEGRLMIKEDCVTTFAPKDKLKRAPQGRGSRRQQPPRSNRSARFYEQEDA